MPLRTRPKLIAGAVAALAAAGGGAAVAATQWPSPQQESEAVVNDAAAQLGVEPGKLKSALTKAFEDRIDAAVAAGRLTQAQANEMKSRLEAGELPLFGGHGLGRAAPFGHDAPFPRLDVAAPYLGLTQRELEQRLNKGQTLADVAKAQGKSVDGLVAALHDAAKKRLDDAVSAGRLTKAREQSILGGLDARLRDFVNDAQLRLEHGPRGFDRDDGLPPAPDGTGA
jgi:hypothetical protein